MAFSGFIKARERPRQRVARRRTGEQTQRGHNTGEQNEQGDKQRTT